MSCPHCPIPDRCPAWPGFCEMAATGDPVALAHIRNRSTRGDAPLTILSKPDRPDAAEVVALIRKVRACPFFSQDLACGCNGVRCGLRPAGRQVGPIQSCFACVEEFGW